MGLIVSLEMNVAQPSCFLAEMKTPTNPGPSDFLFLRHLVTTAPRSMVLVLFPLSSSAGSDSFYLYPDSYSSWRVVDLMDNLSCWEDVGLFLYGKVPSKIPELGGGHRGYLPCVGFQGPMHKVYPIPIDF